MLLEDVEVREYQREAIQNWRNNGYCGIYDMATGERVIIVMGAIYVIKSRVSETLTKILTSYALLTTIRS